MTSFHFARDRIEVLKKMQVSAVCPPRAFLRGISLKGDFRLRSFNTILNFLGRSLGEGPEYHVDKDPRTPTIHENPVHTMELVLPDGAP